MTTDRNKLLELAKEAGCALDQRYKGEVTFISHDALERFAAHSNQSCKDKSQGGDKP
jgi:hypothetical protein